MAKRIVDPKADRKRKLEELKRQQRAKERRKTLTTIAIASVLGIGLIAAVVVPAVLKDRREERLRKAAITTYGVQEAAAECSTETVANPIPPAGEHVATGERVEYTSIPPDGGKHDGSGTLAVRDGFYSEASVELAVHSLEHGAVIGWYDEKLPDAEVELLRKIGISSSDRNMRLIMVPWDRSDFPDNKHFVLTSWGHTLRCGKVSGEVIDKFATTYTNHKDAPEAGASIG